MCIYSPTVSVSHSPLLMNHTAHLVFFDAVFIGQIRRNMLLRFKSCSWKSCSSQRTPPMSNRCSRFLIRVCFRENMLPLTDIETRLSPAFPHEREPPHPFGTLQASLSVYTLRLKVKCGFIQFLFTLLSGSQVSIESSDGPRL